MPLRRNRLVAWIAAFAVLLQALWPLLSQARPQDPSLLVPVCTVDGVTHYLEIKSGGTPLEERSATHGEHCKLCVFGDGKHVAVSVPASFSFLVESCSSREFATPKASFLPATLTPAQSRAPPSQI